MTTAVAPTGLTAAEVAERVARAQVNDVPPAPTRTVAEIVRANALTRFNFLLGSLLAVILVVGPLQDALFGLVLVANTLVGIVQEVRAKRTLERLAVISAPAARVVRDGRTEEVRVGEVVLDDLLRAGPGEQVVVDGEVREAAVAEVDESLLTGESEPVGKRPGDQVLSGSFVVAGTLAYQATKVGREAYAARLAEEARRFTLASSELRAGVDRIIGVVTWLLVPTAVLLLASQLRSQGVSGAVRGAVAGTVHMIPEGLVLLVSVAFAVGVVRLGRQGVLVQELPAVEILARVDVLCFDKTGTITAGDLAVAELVRLPGADGEVEGALGALAAADPAPNATLRAIAAAWPAPAGWAAGAAVPFSSARKWSAASFDGHGTWLLGAPEVLLAGSADGPSAALLRTAEAHAAKGSRVVLLATAQGPVADDDPPRHPEPAALVVLTERVRDDAGDAVAWFTRQAVAAKVVSGDHPRTVAAVASRVGVPGAEEPVDARMLPTEPGALAEVVDRRSVFGRVVPHQKRDMVDALQSRGHVVAMTGDGVNDVLALKEADLGIAMGSGSAAARAVARLVLLDGRFAVLPAVVAEGRRVLANIERVAKLFLTKTVYALLLSLAVGLAGLPFPFLPRHLTLVGSLTIGIPAFFLALEPNDTRARPGFMRRVLAVAVPAGVVAATATFAAYLVARDVQGVTLEQARSVATLTLAGVGVVVLGLVARPLNRLRAMVLVAAVAAFVVVLAVPGLRRFFALSVPPGWAIAAIVALVVAAGAGLAMLLRQVRRRG
ncbi:MAG TPA: HAD-IC family P-type ATPase [Actinomycetota bacterium]|nr:HAD-IC family P-type ATPase [Actinomycetota bacterium]